MTADGKLDKPKILDYIELIMRPEEVKKPLKDGISKCMEEHGEEKILQIITKMLISNIIEINQGKRQKFSRIIIIVNFQKTLVFETGKTINN